jgi:hypothetical protein
MFGWYFIWKGLSNDNILAMEQVGKLELQEWLNYMLINVKERERDKLNESKMTQFA